MLKYTLLYIYSSFLFFIRLYFYIRMLNLYTYIYSILFFSLPPNLSKLRFQSKTPFYYLNLFRKGEQRDRPTKWAI